MLRTVNVLCRLRSYTRDFDRSKTNAANRCVEDLIRVGMIPSESSILPVDVRDVAFANIIYDHNRKAAVARIREFLVRPASTPLAATVTGRITGPTDRF